MEDDEIVLTGRSAELVMALAASEGRTAVDVLERALEYYVKLRLLDASKTLNPVIPNASEAKRNE
jgi:hypothetical protein